MSVAFVSFIFIKLHHGKPNIAI